MFIKDRYTSEIYEIVCVNGQLGVELNESVEEYSSDPVLLDKVNGKYYQFFVISGQHNWEEVEASAITAIEVTDKVTGTLVDVCFYDGQLAWREITRPQAGSIKKLYSQKYWVQKRLEYNVDGIKSFYVAEKYTIVGKLLVYYRENIYTFGINRFKNDVNVQAIGKHKIYHDLKANFAGKRKIKEEIASNLVGINKIRELQTNNIKAKNRFKANISKDLFGKYRQLVKSSINLKRIVKLKQQVNSSIVGERDISNILMALELFDK